MFKNSGETNVVNTGHAEGKEKRFKEQAGSRSLEIRSSSRP